MYDNIFIICGYMGSFTCMIMLFPQVYLTVTTNKTDDLSLKTVSMNLLAQFFFFPYSIYFQLYPLLCANITISICDIILIYVYFKNKYNN